MRSQKIGCSIHKDDSHEPTQQPTPTPTTPEHQTTNTDVEPPQTEPCPTALIAAAPSLLSL